MPASQVKAALFVIVDKSVGKFTSPISSIDAVDIAVKALAWALASVKYKLLPSANEPVLWFDKSVICPV